MTVEEKARTYLGDGRVRVVTAGSGHADILVRGSGVYAVQLSEGRWTCTCPARVERCAHIIAASLVCGSGEFAMVERDNERVVKASALRAGDVCHIGKSPALTLTRDPVLTGQYLRVFWEQNGSPQSVYVKPDDNVRIAKKTTA